MNIYPDCGDLSNEVKKQHSLLGHSKVTQIFSKLIVDSDAQINLAGRYSINIRSGNNVCPTLELTLR